MIGLGRGFRLVPIVVLATGSLFALKTISLFLDGSFTLGRSSSAHAAAPSGSTGTVAADAGGSDMRNAGPLPPALGGSKGDPDITGTTAAAKPPEPKSADPKAPPAA